MLVELGNTAGFSGEGCEGGIVQEPRGWEHTLDFGRCSRIGHVAQELFFCGFIKMQVSLNGKRADKGQTQWFQQQMPAVEVLQSTRIEV